MKLLSGIGIAWMLSWHAIAGAQTHIDIPGERVIPESLTATSDGLIFIGSLGARTIFRAKVTDSQAESWTQPPLEPSQGIYGVFADERTKTLYACVSGFGESAAAELLSLDLSTGKLKERYPFPSAGGLCNDIATAADGTAYVTDSRNMEMLRLKPQGKALEKWVGDGTFGPKGGVLDGISVLGNRVLVNTLTTNKLFSVPVERDGQAGAVVEVRLDRAIAGPDGMRSLGANSLVLAESDGGRVSRVDLSGDTGKVTTLRDGFPSGPVSAAVIGSQLYVVDAQFSGMRANAFKPFQVQRFALPTSD